MSSLMTSGASWDLWLGLTFGQLSWICLKSVSAWFPSDLMSFRNSSISCYEFLVVLIWELSQYLPQCDVWFLIFMLSSQILPTCCWHRTEIKHWVTEFIPDKSLHLYLFGTFFESENEIKCFASGFVISRDRFFLLWVRKHFVVKTDREFIDMYVVVLHLCCASIYANFTRENKSFLLFGIHGHQKWAIRWYHSTEVWKCFLHFWRYW